MDIARGQLGTPYVWGAEDPTTGFDCSGLIQYTYWQLASSCPRQSRPGAPAASLRRSTGTPGRPGRLRLAVDHIGIYACGNTMVVASHAGDVGRVQQITRTPTAIRRVE